jgi:hypothetical protein
LTKKNAARSKADGICDCEKLWFRQSQETALAW